MFFPNFFVFNMRHSKIKQSTCNRFVFIKLGFQRWILVRIWLNDEAN